MSSSTSFFFLIKFFFRPYRTACGNFVPWLGIEPVPPAVEAPSPNCWTAREVLVLDWDSYIQWCIHYHTQVLKLFHLPLQTPHAPVHNQSSSNPAIPRNYWSVFCLYSFTFSECHNNGTRQHVALGVWFFSHSVMHVSLLHVVSFISHSSRYCWVAFL